MTSDSFDYDGTKRKAIATGNVKMVRPDMVLNTNTLYIDRELNTAFYDCLLYTSPSPRDRQKSRMPSSA